MTFIFFKLMQLILILSHLRQPGGKSRNVSQVTPTLCQESFSYMSLEILVAILPFFDFASPLHVACWSAYLLAFYMLARKSNLIPSSLGKFDVKTLTGSFVGGMLCVVTLVC